MSDLTPALFDAEPYRSDLESLISEVPVPLGNRMVRTTTKAPGGVAKQKCTWCEQVRPVAEFARSERGWITRECLPCQEERLECWERSDRYPPVRGRRYVDEGATHLVCARCGRARSKKLFYTYEDGRSKDRYYRRNCKQCSHALNGNYRSGRPAKRTRKDRERWLRKKYGITLAEYESMLEQQQGLCAICGTDAPGGPTPESAFHVDHDHSTGRVRGLLCRACNTALGLFNDQPQLLTAAIRYLMEAPRG